MQIIDEIKEIIDKWYNERNIVIKRMSQGSPVQLEYKEKIELKLNKLLEYVQTNFSNN